MTLPIEPERTARRAAIVGAAEYKTVKMNVPDARTSLEAAADLGLRALDDAGLSLRDVDGLYCVGVHESAAFVPSTVCEYLGLRLDHAGTVDLGGANAVAMVARAAMAIAAGEASIVLCITPGWPAPADPDRITLARRFGASSYLPGSPQAEFDIPLGHVNQNALYAMVAQRYHAAYGYDAHAVARVVAHARANAAVNPDAIFFGQAVSEEDVLASRMIAAPIRMLEIVMPVRGGAAVVVADPAIAARCRHRAAMIAGWGERLTHKSPQHAPDLLHPPMEAAAARAFARADLRPADVDTCQIYDCYPINTIMTLEAAGFCAHGDGMNFARHHDMRFAGDFPLNTNGGQLGMGQAGYAGGMTHVVEAFRQISGRAQSRQVRDCDVAFVSGNGGIMSEQIAMLLEGA